MDLLTLVTIVARRWYAFLAILALTAIALWEISPKLALQYQSQGSLLILAPNTTTLMIGAKPTQVPINPLLSTGSPSLTVAETLANDVGSLSTRQAVQLPGNFSYTVTVDSKAPIVTIEDTADTPEYAVQGVEILLERMQNRLGSLEQQLKAPPEQLLESKILNVLTVPSELTGSKNKTVFLVAAAGFLVALSMSVTLDGILTRGRPTQAAPAKRDREVA